MQQQSRSRRQRHQKKKTSIWSRLRVALGVILILVAAVLFALDPIKNYMVKRGTESNIVGNLSRDQIEANLNRNATFDFDDISYIDPMTVITDGVNPDDLPVIGGLAIPELDMNLPIHLGTDNAGMYYGAGTLYADQQMGVSNYPLASHHSSNPSLLFAPLLQAEKGMTAYMTDLENIYVYDIDYIETVDPYFTEVLHPTEEPVVTLITCSYDLVNRIIVRGTLVETVPMEKATTEMINAFGIKQTIVGNE